MRILPAVLRQGLFFCLFCCSFAFAAPDPRDSIILESKSVYPGAGSPALFLRVFFTNKDTLRHYGLTLVEKSVSGGAYLVLARPRTYDGVIHHLDSSLSVWKGDNFDLYDGVSPDTFIVAGFGVSIDPATVEPPNLTRKAFLEIKFDTIRSSLGTVVIDSTNTNKMGGTGLPVTHNTGFTNFRFQNVEVNFIKATITVAEPPPPPPPCDDLSGDGNFTAADAVLAINCVFGGTGDCDKLLTPADVQRLLNRLFFDPDLKAPLVPPPPC